MEPYVSSASERKTSVRSGWWKYNWMAFALIGAASRFHFTNVESRVQILAFWLAAVVLHLVLGLSRVEDGIGWMRVVLNGAAATAAIILVKIALEGVPGVG